MKKLIPLLFAAALLSIFTVTCSPRDDRDRLRVDLGDPDQIETLGKEQFWREFWTYDMGTEIWQFQFMRSSGCGAVAEVYLVCSVFTPCPIVFVKNPGDSSSVTPQFDFKKGSNPVSPNF